ncbi:MAG: response regulator [Thermodesulfobacteriota bacterium]
MEQILVVDDCSVTRKLLSFMIEHKGYSILGATNGVEALEKLAGPDVDLIITDLNMPLMDGLEFVKNVRDIVDYRHIPIIMLTTEAGDEDRRLAAEAGVSTYLVKPVEAEDLIGEIEKLIH